MAISIIEHNGMLTNKIVGTFQEDIPVRAGFSAWFPRETTPTFLVDIRVKRGTRKIAVDVERFTEGNKTKSSRLTEHLYKPPFYRQEYDFVRDEIFMRALELNILGNAASNKSLGQSALDSLRENRDMIERAIRKQQADVLQDGIVRLKNGDNIVYRRKAESMVDVSTGAGEYWSNSASSTPLADIAKGGVFLRNIGNSSGNTLNMVASSAAIQAFFASAEVKASADFRWIERINVGFPEFNDATGFTYQGQVAAGDYRVNIWSYNELYEDENGNNIPYLAEGNVVLLPADFQGKTVFGALADMSQKNIGGTSVLVPTAVESEFLLRGYADEKTISSTLELSSAPIVIPITIDKMYTMKVLA